MALSCDDIVHLLADHGQRQYGREAVSQLEHALQCAQLAQDAGETQHTIVAALLHDLGHLLAAQQAGAQEAPDDEDDLHQYKALPFLKSLLPESVLAPIRLHVDAKRYLCAAELGYWDTLSPASKHSLTLQGGVFDAVAAASFAALPYAQEAIRLRRYDDLAKVPGQVTRPLPHFERLLAHVALA